MLLHKSTNEALTSYLTTKSFINKDQQVLSTGKPGEGNMNYIIRVILNDGTLILKQSNPYVEKYPSVAAPQERAISEARFYTTVKDNATLSAMMPRLIASDKENFINVFEDLGNAEDVSFLYYSDEQLMMGDIKALSEYLSELHNSFSTATSATNFSNSILKQLNHEHIFVYPFMEDNGFDLDGVQAGLQELSLKYKRCAELKSVAIALGEKYLAAGKHLIHGDFYHGSWVRSNGKLFVIDPEFCHYGLPEFDLGVMKAHMHLTGELETVIDVIHEYYKAPAGFNQQLCNQFTGIEILRRIFGLAQLPLKISLQEKEVLAQKAIKFLGLPGNTGREYA